MLLHGEVPDEPCVGVVDEQPSLLLGCERHAKAGHAGTVAPATDKTGVKQ
jgi:hypothetical protein